MEASLRKHKHYVLFLAFTLIGSVAAAQDTNGDGRITYLVPINVPQPIPGAVGTTWQTELWVYNGSNSPINIRGCLNLAIPSLCQGIPLHPVGVTEKAFSYETVDQDSTFRSFIFDLFPSQMNVVVKSRLYELSRHTQPAGIELPVIREDRFFRTASRFIGINGTAAFRAALRIYDARARANDAFRVEFFRSDGSLILDSVQVLSPGSEFVRPSSAAILDLAQAFPQLTGVDRYDIRVTPISPGIDYWAFVSITDQETQQVLLVTAD